MSRYAEHNWYTLAFDADKVAEVIPEDYEYKNGKVWGGSDLSQAIEWMRKYNEHDRTLFRVSVSVEAVHIEGVSAPSDKENDMAKVAGSDFYTYTLTQRPRPMVPDADAVERVAKAIYEHDMTWVGPGTPFKSWEETATKDIYRGRGRAAVGVVEADVSRRLLSDNAKIAAAHHMQELAAQGVWSNEVHAYEGMKAALAAIGIEVAE